ncbi:uncharacterized protein KQ657_002284 [Scheffersomyces spartinae]|uniref:Rho-GAP domain-containing protein n=1 Tax=Scheffersomyces spartinae TaxID=45513 RepID=A0A9P7VDL1_9ASCO|nr:uncharacterized protein KQ657_002284 [Scheffersomyces spartinae]KAG7195899.1 hypothetical protein KQ657_002284 [Scheffersomyces spartinae]
MDRIFYRSPHYDDPTGYPLYIFDTSFLPPPETVNYDALVPQLMGRLPSVPYTVVMFCCGLNKISWLTGIKFIQSFVTATNSNGQHQLDLVSRIITVHDSWLVRSITEFWTAYASQRRRALSLTSLISQPQSLLVAQKPILHFSCLADLTSILDVSKLKLSLNIYRHDCEIDLDKKLQLKYYPPLISENEPVRIDLELSPILYHHFYLIFGVLNQHGTQVPLVFFKPGNKTNTDIFYDAINRNQVLYINDFDLYCIATVFKRIIYSLSSPLINVNCITLPLGNDFEYTRTIFSSIIQTYENPEDLQIILQLLSLCLKLIQNLEITSLTSITLAKSLVHCLTHQVVSSQNKDQVAIATRFLKNLIESWPLLIQLSQFSLTYIPVEHALKVGVPFSSSEEGKDLPPTPVTANETKGDTISFRLEDISYPTCQVEKSLTSTEDGLEPPPVLEKSKRELPSIPIEEQDGGLSSLLPPPPPPEFGTSISLDVKELPATPNISSPSASPPGTPNSRRLKPTRLRSSYSRSPKGSPKRILMQFPPQKYKFQSHKSHSSSSLTGGEVLFDCLPNKSRKTVIRGRRVGELTKLFEERAEAMQIIRDL